jgi:hypothetical protein
MNTKEKYTAACNEYLRAFCKKHNFEYDPQAWVGSEAGDIALLGDYYTDMRTIITDIEHKAPEEAFFRWYDYCLRANAVEQPTPNFESWLAGCPVVSEEKLAQLEAMKANIEKLKKEFQDLIQTQ